MLEAISYQQLAATPHRSILNVTDVDTLLSDAPTSELQFSVAVDELRKLVAPHPNLYVGVGDLTGHFYTQDLDQLQKRLKNESLILEIKVNYAAGNFSQISFDQWPSGWRNLSSIAQLPSLQIQNSTGDANSISNFQIQSDDLNQLSQKLHAKIYRFSSERPVQVISTHHANGELLPNSSNLAYCINHLQSNNKDLFDDLNKLLHRVFPTIYWVGAPPNGNNQFELKVHTNPSSLKRGDLAVPINQVGTGVGNALAMLYVALTAQTQRFILLEEPNSFLHPRALRELPENKADKTIHAAKVLNFVFQSLGTLEYRKTAHGPKITEWLLANQPGNFKELKKWFERFLSTQN